MGSPTLSEVGATRPESELGKQLRQEEMKRMKTNGRNSPNGRLRRKGREEYVFITSCDSQQCTLYNLPSRIDRSGMFTYFVGRKIPIREEVWRRP